MMNITKTFLFLLIAACSNIREYSKGELEPVSVNEKGDRSKEGYLYDKKCSDQKDEDGNFWARGDGRSQAGGWIWFLGKGSSENYNSSFEKAEGLAVSRLVRECGFAHNSARFNERCVNKTKNLYQAYARIAIKQKDCKSSVKMQEHERRSLVNRELNRLYLKYLKDVEKEDLKCTVDNPDVCLKLARQENINNNLSLAKKYSITSCLNSKDADIGKACFYAGLYTYDLGGADESLDYFARSCDAIEDYEAGCQKFTAHSLKLNKKKQALWSSHKICNKKTQIGCYPLVFLLEEFSQFEKAKSTSKKACLDWKDANSCFLYGGILLESSDKKEREDGHRAYHRGCYLGSESSCYFAGKAIIDGQVKPSKEEGLVGDSINNQLAAKYFQMACSIGETSLGRKACGLSERIKSHDSDKMQKTINNEFDISKNKSKLQTECSKNNSDSCIILGAGQMKKYFAQKDIKFFKAAFLNLKKSCDLSNHRGCCMFGILIRKFGRHKQANLIFKKACSLGSQKACDILKN